MSDVLFSPSFARSTSNLTDSNFALTQKPKTGTIAAFNLTVGESTASAFTDTEFDCTVWRYAINPKTAPYIVGEKYACSGDALTQT